jgi:large subunit ribosomal protein L22
MKIDRENMAIKPDVYNYMKNIFCSSKKLRPVLDLVRGQNVARALHILQNCSKKKCAHIISKSINAAMANGVNGKNFLKENLVISAAFANKGKTMKRLFPRAKGSSNVRYKHVSNLYIGLENHIENKTQGKGE